MSSGKFSCVKLPSAVFDGFLLMILLEIRRDDRHAEIGYDGDDMNGRPEGLRIFRHGRYRVLPALVINEVDGQ